MRFLAPLACLLISVAARPGYEPYAIHAPVALYHGPPAPLDHEGRVIDTPEVAHAKAMHFAAHAAEAAKASHSPEYAVEDYSYGHGGGFQNFVQPYEHKYAVAGPAKYHEPVVKYHGPPAPLAHDGRVIDTPEVAHAKAAHLAAHAEELNKIHYLASKDPYPEHHP